MAGLDKIIAEIRDEAAKEAEQALAAAREEAGQILAAAKESSNAKVAAIKAEAAHDVAEIERSRESAIVLQHRQRALSQKQALLAETLQKGLATLYALPEAEYFSLLVRLAAANAQPGEGEVLLNEKDRARLPKDFAASLAGALPAGTRLAISNAVSPIDSGFVLKYGDIEQNCSFAAIFDARADEFSDLIRETLFA